LYCRYALDWCGFQIQKPGAGVTRGSAGWVAVGPANWAGISRAGFALAVGITRALAYIPIREYVGTPEISPEVAVATMVLLSAIGLTAGLLPAKRAANLNVVDCLRA